MDIGKVGVWTGYGLIGKQNAGEAVALAEALGFGTFWLGGAPRLPTLRPLLEASERIVIATGIVSLWRTPPEQLALEFADLEADFPGRVLLGMGISHPEILTDYRTPLTLMREFFDAIDVAVPGVPRERRCLAALGPKMLDLSAERSLGTHTYFVPATHTALARKRLGVGPIVAPEVACVLDTDVERARATARRYAERYLGLVNYASNLRRLGFGEDDLADGGSDRLIDAVIPQGSPAHIASAVREHFEAGADHVCLQPVGVQGVPRREWSALAEALL